MLKEANKGIFFRTTKKIAAEYPDYPVVYEYAELKDTLKLLKIREKN